MKAKSRLTKQGKRLRVAVKAANMTFWQMHEALERNGDDPCCVMRWLYHRRPLGRAAVQAIARTLGAPAALYVVYG